MSFFDTTGFSGGDPAPGYSFTDSVDTSQQLGADTSYDAPATLAPIYPGQDASSGDSAPSGWGDYFKGLGTTVVGYLLQKDAAKTAAGNQQQGAGNGAGNQQQAVQQRKAAMSPVMLLLLGGAVVFVAVKLAK